MLTVVLRYLVVIKKQNVEILKKLNAQKDDMPNTIKEEFRLPIDDPNSLLRFGRRLEANEEDYDKMVCLLSAHYFMLKYKVCMFVLICLCFPTAEVSDSESHTCRR